MRMPSPSPCNGFVMFTFDKALSVAFLTQVLDFLVAYVHNMITKAIKKTPEIIPNGTLGPHLEQSLKKGCERYDFKVAPGDHWRPIVCPWATFGHLWESSGLTF